MAIVSDQYAALGPEAKLVVYYDDALAVDDPAGPPGNKWDISACDLDHFELTVDHTADIWITVSSKGQGQGPPWFQAMIPAENPPFEEVFTAPAGGSMSKGDDLARLTLGG